MSRCRLEIFLIFSIVLFTISTAQNFIQFDKVIESDNENEIIPSVFRKKLPLNHLIPTTLQPKQNILPKHHPQLQPKQNILPKHPQLQPTPVIKITINREKLIQQSEEQQAKQQQHKREQPQASGPPLIVLGSDAHRQQHQQHQQQHQQQQQHGVQPRQIQGGKASVSSIITAADGSGNYQQQYNGYQEHRYLPPQVVNPGFPAWNPGSGCSSCTSYDYSYRQRCCTFGHKICCTVNPPYRPTPSYGHTEIGILGNFNQPQQQQYNYQSYGNDRWGWNNREKPGTCYRPPYQSHFGNNQGWNPHHASNNHNAGYYFERADVNIDRDFTPEVGHGGYNNHQTQSYGVPAPQYSGGSGGGYAHASTGGYGGGGGGSGGGYGNRPHYQWSSCRKDFECPGNQKCCQGRCSTPSFIG